MIRVRIACIIRSTPRVFLCTHFEAVPPFFRSHCPAAWATSRRKPKQYHEVNAGTRYPSVPPHLTFRYLVRHESGRDSRTSRYLCGRKLFIELSTHTLQTIFSLRSRVCLRVLTRHVQLFEKIANVLNIHGVVSPVDKCAQFKGI